MKLNQFTPQQILEIKKLYLVDKLGADSIGKLFDTSKPTILKLLKNNNILVRQSGHPDKGGKTEADKRYYKKNKSIIQIKYKTWAENNRDNLREYHTSWRKDNIETVRQQKRDLERNKSQNDPEYRFKKYLKTALWQYVKDNNVTYNNSLFDNLDYSIIQLKEHLEKLFTPGMSWDNYGKWHVDHIYPQTKFDFTSFNDLEFKKCWALNNLRPMWAINTTIDGVKYDGNLNKNSKITDLTCHQYKIRVAKKVEETTNLDFDYTKIILKESEVRLITKSECVNIIHEYEWLQCMPAFSTYHFGIFFKVEGKEYLGGVLCFQEDYAENTNNWDKFGFSNKLLLLSRGVCIWWTPKNSASYFISRATKWILENTKYRVITATIDPLANEFGTIYQSLNWNYVGLMSGNLDKNGKPLKRFGVILDGKLYGSRYIRNKLGTIKKEEIIKHYPDAIFVSQERKHRYFYFLGSKSEIKQNKKIIQKEFKPYPKRFI